MDIFGKRVDVLVPFPRNDTVNEIMGRIQRTFCSVYKYFNDKETYNKNVLTDICNNYSYHKKYLCEQHFFSDNAKVWMNNNDLDGKKLNITFNTTKYDIRLKLNIYGTLTRDELLLLITKTITMIIVNKIYKCELEINLILLPIERVYPDKFKINSNMVLGVNEANGGFTTWRGNEWGKIYVWRKEELDKVVVHEMIHALHLDFKSYDLMIDQFFYDNFYIEKDGSFLFFEAYTEIWAEFLNIIFNHSYDICTLGENNTSLGQFYDRLCRELNFSLIQVSKMMLWFGFKTFSNCGFHCKDKCKKVDQRMKEATSIFSYYIVRSIYFYCLPQFLNVCVDNKSKGKSAMDDKNNINRHILYLNILKENIDAYGKEIDNIMEKLKNKEIELDEKILNTMRMTCEHSRCESF